MKNDGRVKVKNQPRNLNLNVYAIVYQFITPSKSIQIHSKNRDFQKLNNIRLWLCNVGQMHLTYVPFYELFDSASITNLFVCLFVQSVFSVMLVMSSSLLYTTQFNLCTHMVNWLPPNRIQIWNKQRCIYPLMKHIETKEQTIFIVCHVHYFILRKTISCIFRDILMHNGPRHWLNRHLTASNGKCVDYFLITKYVHKSIEYIFRFYGRM